MGAHLDWPLPMRLVQSARKLQAISGVQAGEGQPEGLYPTVPHYQNRSDPHVDATGKTLFHFGSPND